LICKLCGFFFGRHPRYTGTLGQAKAEEVSCPSTVLCCPLIIEPSSSRAAQPLWFVWLPLVKCKGDGSQAPCGQNFGSVRNFSAAPCRRTFGLGVEAVRLLIDTHALLWRLSDDPALSGAARKAMAQTSNVLLCCHQ
jgi:hypothetical protein